MFSKFKKWFHYWIIEKPVSKEEVVEESSDKQVKEILEKSKKTATKIRKEVSKTQTKAKAKSKPVRKRTIKGRYVADDPSTPDVNEAWVGGKAPTRKSKTKVIRKKAKS
jgi:hypothetical protein